MNEPEAACNSIALHIYRNIDAFLQSFLPTKQQKYMKRKKRKKKTKKKKNDRTINEWQWQTWEEEQNSKHTNLHIETNKIHS